MCIWDETYHWTLKSAVEHFLKKSVCCKLYIYLTISLGQRKIILSLLMQPWNQVSSSKTFQWQNSASQAADAVAAFDVVPSTENPCSSSLDTNKISWYVQHTHMRPAVQSTYWNLSRFVGGFSDDWPEKLDQDHTVCLIMKP